MPSPIKPSFKTELLPLAAIILSFAAAFYFYANFPPRVPIHWNASGEVDGYGSPGFAAFMIPALNIGFYFLFLLLPYIDPKKDRYADFTGAYHAFKTAIIVFLSAMYFLASLNGLGYAIRMDVWMPIMFGALFFLLGIFMHKLKPNWFMGIRTPWTLSSESVWVKTHRAAGRLFMLGGILMIFSFLLPSVWRFGLILIFAFSILLFSLGYSFYLYKKEGR